MIELLISFLKEYGLIALFLVSLFSNFLIFPAFVELSCIIFLSLSFSPTDIFLYLSLGSVSGGVISYFSSFFTSRVMLKYEHRIKDMKRLIERYGKLSVFIVSFLPMPFPFALFAMLVGVLKMNFKSFFFPMVIGKSLRVGLVLIVLIFGAEILKILI